MPQALPFILAAAAKYLTGNAIIAWVVGLGSSLAVNEYERKKANAAARDAYNQSLRDRLAMTATTDRARTVLLGRVRNCDGVIYKATHGPDKRYYTLVVALGVGPIDGIEDVYFGDVKLELNAQTGAVTNLPYATQDKVSVQESLTITAGSGLVVLAHTPVAGSVSVVSEPSGDIGGIAFGSVNFTLSGSTVSVSGYGSTDAVLIVVYQYVNVRPYAWVKKYNGALDQDISADLIATGAPQIVAGVHRFSGIALLSVTLEFNPDVYPAGVPAISAVCRGSPVLDVRTGITTWTNPNSPMDYPHPGQNPALCAYHWATHPNGGALEPSEAIVDSFKEAANACDVSTEFNVTTLQGFNDSPIPTESHKEPRYVCAHACRTDAGADGIFADLVASMAGLHGWSGGRLRVRAGAWRIPLVGVTLTEDWVSASGSIDLSPGTSSQDTINIIRPSIADETQDFAVTPVREVKSAPYIEADGIELPIEMSFNAVTSPYHVQDLCEVQLLESRQALTVELTCKFHAFQLDLFDIVPVTLSGFGWTDKLFEVRSWSFTMDGGVRLQLRETSESTYDPASLFTLDDRADNTNLPNPWLVDQLTGLTVSSVAALDNDLQVVTRTLVTWNALVNAAVVQSGHVEIQWASIGLAPATAGWVNDSNTVVPWSNDFDEIIDWFLQASAALTDSDWNGKIEPGSATSTTVIGLRSGYGYIFRARATTVLVRGPWSIQKGIIIPSVASTDSAALAAAEAAAANAAASAAAAQAAANQALDNVQDAITAADSATASAAAATTAITNFALDNILSPVEKMAVILDYNSLIAEQTGIDDQADDYSITAEKTAYDTALADLTSYLNGLPEPTGTVPWNDTSGDTEIVGTTFRSNFLAAYDARQTLLNKIAEEAGKRAAWTNITGIPYESIYTNDDAVALGFNPTFSAWTGSYPDGWAQWQGAAPTKETTLVRIGPYSVRWSVSGGNVGMLAQSTWTAAPMGTGTFVAGSIDVRMVSRTSGLPEIAVELFTNAGLSTSVVTAVQPSSTGVGAWQRQVFTARVGESERIYGIRMFVRASNTGAASGAFTGDVVFSNLRLAFFDQSIDNTKITITDAGWLQGAGGGHVTISGLGFTGDLNATYGASAATFTGHIGAGNVLQRSAFRTDSTEPPDGLSDGWTVLNGSAGTEPITPSRVAGGGVFGTDAQVLTWSVNNTSTKGLTSAVGAGYGVQGGWLASQTYVVSWYAKATGTNVGKTMSLNWSTAPSSTTELNNPALSSSFQRYASRIVWGGSVEASGKVGITIAVDSLSQGSLTISAVQVTKGDVLTEYMEAVEDVRIAASVAQQLALDAYDAAQDALTAIGVAVTDNVLTSTEKPIIKSDVDQILAEETGIDNEALSHAIAEGLITAYDNAIEALVAYLDTLVSPTAWNDRSGSTTIVGTTFWQNFANVYSTRQAVLNAIAAKDLAVANAAAEHGNLINASWWRQGVSPYQWNDNINGNGATDQFIQNYTHDGTVQIVWRTTAGSQAGAELNNGGGWYVGPEGSTNWFRVDPTKTYVFACFQRKISGGSVPGYGYWGTGGNLVCEINTATPQSNPYFVDGFQFPLLDRSYLFIGWVYPAGSTGMNNTGAGVYDCVTGLKVRDGFNWCWNASTTHTGTRAYQFYAKGAIQEFERPLVYMCNGSEPTLDSLLGAARARQAQQTATDAQNDANRAMQGIADMASDSVITPVEKPTLIRDWDVISDEQAGIDYQAGPNGYNIGTGEKEDYDNAITALANYLSTLNTPTAWNFIPALPTDPGNTYVNGATLRTSFYWVYYYRQVLLNRIAALAQLRADWPNVTNISVSTPQIQDFAATYPLSLESDSGSVTATTSGGSTFAVNDALVPSVPAVIYWQNTSTVSFTVQLEFAISISVATGPAGANRSGDVWGVVNTSSGQFSSGLSNVNEGGSIAFADVRMITVAPGAWVQAWLHVRARVSGANASTTVTWTKAIVRLTVIKK